MPGSVHIFLSSAFDQIDRRFHISLAWTFSKKILQWAAISSASVRRVTEISLKRNKYPFWNFAKHVSSICSISTAHFFYFSLVWCWLHPCWSSKHSAPGTWLIANVLWIYDRRYEPILCDPIWYSTLCRPPNDTETVVLFMAYVLR